MAEMTPKAARLAAVIQRTVAASLERDFHDPRLRGVTITEVRVTNDLHIARVYWTQLGEVGKESGERERARAALNQAKGRLRSKVGRKAGTRLTPQLEFIFDEVPATAADVDDMLVHAARRDEILSHLREGKSYAGDADPYRHDEDSDDNGIDEDVEDSGVVGSDKASA
ncbi:MAG: 30S ribosome-binding factor RbfA [Bifidobacteriaceae bacterium]|nr:30S ribosome-binding factor RbfA [Bifidobacteriaceae bacterium]